MMDYGISSVRGRRNDFRKADDPGENSFAKEFSPGPPFRKLLNGCGEALVWQQVRLPAHELKKHI